MVFAAAESASLILFAIRSGVRLGEAIRQGVVDDTKQRPLTIPPPDCDFTPNWRDAEAFFQPKDETALSPEVAKILAVTGDLTVNQKELLVQEYQAALCTEWFSVAVGTGRNADPEVLAVQCRMATLRIKQWSEVDNLNATILTRLSGALVETGIDYFRNIPGAIDSTSKYGKVALAYLDGISTISFSSLTTAQIQQLPIKLFSAALSTVAEHADSFSNDTRIQTLVQASAKQMMTDSVALASNRALLGDKRRVEVWAETIFRGIIKSVGGVVLENPDLYLGIKGTPSQALVENVGKALLEVMVDSPTGALLEDVLTTETVEKLSSAALGVLAQYPELVSSYSPGVKTLISQLASDLSTEIQRTGLAGKDLVPDVMRLVLQRTGENLLLLWPNAAANPQLNLGLLVAQKVLAEVAKVPTTGKWKLSLSQTQVLDIVDFGLQQLAANPTWVLDSATSVRPEFSTALGAMLAAIRKNADFRLTTASAVDLLKTGMLAVAANSKLVIGTAGAAPLISSVLDLLLGKLFANSAATTNAQWVLIQQQLLDVLYGKLTKALSAKATDANVLTNIGTYLDGLITRVNQSGAVEWKSEEAELNRILGIVTV